MKATSKQGALSGPFQWLSAIFFVGALIGICILIVSDAIRHMRFSTVHQHLAAPPLILIGLSYICLQMSLRRPKGEMIKGLMLGAAFMLWGCEQLLPPSWIVTVMDGMVVTIFVVDLSAIVMEHLKRKDHEVP